MTAPTALLALPRHIRMPITHNLGHHHRGGLTADRVFGWIVHAAIWHLVGDILRRYPAVAEVFTVATVLFAAWWVVKLLMRRTRRVATNTARRTGRRAARGAAKTAIKSHTGQPIAERLALTECRG